MKSNFGIPGIECPHCNKTITWLKYSFSVCGEFEIKDDECDLKNSCTTWDSYRKKDFMCPECDVLIAQSECGAVFFLLNKQWIASNDLIQL